jgi:RHS repeat-associated protein
MDPLQPSVSIELVCTTGPQSTTNTPPSPSRNTGKERDTESGLDYFNARYYGSSMGRFMSPDPSGLFYADQTNPQSLNLYSYVRNNPLINIDPTGLDCVYIDPDSGQYQGWNAGDCDNSTTARANAGNYFDGHVTDVNENSSGQVTSFGGNPDDPNSPYTLTMTGFPLSSQQSSQFDNPLGDALFAQNGVGAQYFGAANKAVTYATVGYFGAVGAGIGGAAALGTYAPYAGFARVAIGPFLGNPIHFAVGVGESWMHGLGVAGAAGAIPMISQLADRFAGSAFQLSIPVLNTVNVLPTEGTLVTNCFTGACAAIGQGWIP